jgi:Putative transposase/Transposase zinc-binding domain
MAPRNQGSIVYEHQAGAARLPLAAGYHRREPERSILYAVVQENLQSCLSRARERDPNGYGLPSFIEREFTRYLQCGILAHGFVRVHCDGCGRDRLVGFSCKGRAVCPSCNARRMHDTAAHLVDRVLPDGIRYRQWVLSLPRWVRFKLAYQPKLVTRVLQLFLRAIFAWQRRQARRLGIPDGRPGAVTFVQRFGSALNLNVHFHALVPDGVFTGRSGQIELVALSPPSNEEVEAIARKVARRTLALIAKVDEHAETVVGECADPYASTVQDSLRQLASSTDDLPIQRGRRAAFLQGFSVHANVSIGAGKRDALERLCRYGARPPIALGRLGTTRDGKITYRVKHRAPGAPELLVLTELELLEKLAALVPSPRVHLVRYHGVFAPHAKWRAHIVPRKAAAGLSAPVPSAPERRRVDLDGSPPRQRRLDWAALLLRVFKIDVLECERCGDRMRVLAFLTDPDVTRGILAHLGLSATAPVLKPARDPPALDSLDGVASDQEATFHAIDFIPPDED